MFYRVVVVDTLPLDELVQPTTYPRDSSTILWNLPNTVRNMYILPLLHCTAPITAKGGGNKHITSAYTQQHTCTSNTAD